MLSDFELITHQFPDRQDITIYPISDVHLGAAEHMTREWELFCQRVVNEPNSYIILGVPVPKRAKDKLKNVRDSIGEPRN